MLAKLIVVWATLVALVKPCTVVLAKFNLFPIPFNWSTILFLVSINWFKASGVGQYCSFTWFKASPPWEIASSLAWLNWFKRNSSAKDWSLVITNLITCLPKFKIRCPNLFFPLGLTCSGVLSSITDSGTCWSSTVCWTCCLVAVSSCLVCSICRGVTVTSGSTSVGTSMLSSIIVTLLP